MFSFTTTMKRVKSSESQSKSIEWILFNMERWVMLETKKLEVVKKEIRSSNSISKSMRWKVSAELLLSKLKFWHLKKRFKEKRTKSWSNNWDNSHMLMKFSARSLRRVSMKRQETRWSKVKLRLPRRKAKLLRKIHWHLSWRNSVLKTPKSSMKKLLSM